jgi:hypothetical protein
MHGIESFFLGIANAIISLWQGRALLYRPSFFDEPKAKRRSQILGTFFCVLATLFLLGLAFGAVWLIWWAFTRHQRM